VNYKLQDKLVDQLLCLPDYQSMLLAMHPHILIVFETCNSQPTAFLLFSSRDTQYSILDTILSSNFFILFS